MDPKLKKTWLKALRSGEYKQGQGVLCKKGGFCCLGVAYDVLEDGDWELVDAEEGRWKIPSKLNTGAQFLPRPDMYSDWGLDHDDVQRVAKMNDEGKSFEEIADWIEAEL